MRRRVREAGRRTFRAITVRNYRLYFTGQVISVSGTWMQTVAQAYLILFALHGTGVDVAIATSLQFLPLLLLGPFGGLIADRLDKRKVLYATQGAAGALALHVQPTRTESGRSRGEPRVHSHGSATETGRTPQGR